VASSTRTGSAWCTIYCPGRTVPRPKRTHATIHPHSPPFRKHPAGRPGRTLNHHRARKAAPLTLSLRPLLSLSRCIASQAGPFDAWLPSASVMAAVAAAAAAAVGTGRLFRNAAAEDFHTAAALHLTTGVVGIAVWGPDSTDAHPDARSPWLHSPQHVKSLGWPKCSVPCGLSTLLTRATHCHLAFPSHRPLWLAPDCAYGGRRASSRGDVRLRRGRRQAVGAAVWKLDRPFCTQLAALRRGTLTPEMEAKAE